MSWRTRISWRHRSYEELPALSVRGPELRRSLRTITIAWMFGIVWMVYVGGSRAIIFGRMLGFSDFHFGLMWAVPFAMTIGQLLAVILIERTGLRKQLFIDCGLIGRLMWIVIAVVPFVLPVPSPLAVWTMLALFSVGGFMAAMSITAWWTWMGDLIPRRIRGRYLATHSLWAQTVKIPMVIVLAIVLDYLTRYDAVTGERLAMTPSCQPVLLRAICAVFALAGILGAIDTLFFRRIREVFPSTYDQPRRPAVDIRVSPAKNSSIFAHLGYAGRYLAQATEQLLVDPLRDHAFRRYAFFGAAVAFAMAVAGPFYWRNSLTNLGFSQTGTDMMFLVVGPLTGIVSLRFWGRLIDRWGRRPSMMLGVLCTMLSIIPYFLASRHNHNPQFVIDAVNWCTVMLGRVVGVADWRLLTPQMPVGAWLVMVMSPLIGSVGWSGVMLAQNGLVMGLSDGPGRSKYVAAYAMFMSMGGVIGGVVGGCTASGLDFLQQTPIVLGPLVWNNWHATFLLSLLARIVTLIALIHMPDPGSGRFRDMTRYLRGNVYNQLVVRVFYPLRVLSRRRRGDNQSKRRQSPPRKRNRKRL